MAELNKTDFESRYNHVSTGLYIDNTTNAISEADLRDLVTYIKDSVLFRKDDRYTLFQQFTTATSTTAYTGTPSPAISAYATGQVFQVKAHATSTGSVTLNLNGLGAKKVYTDPTTQATTGSVVINSIYLFIYDAALDTAAGGFIMIGGSGGVTGSGTTNELAYWTSSSALGALAVATYPSLTEMTYVKGLTSAAQTQLTARQLLVNSATAITDAATMDLTAIKHTLTTSTSTRTFTISYTGDDITLEVTLNTTTSTFTFPASTLCTSEGIASGTNAAVLSGVSGDKYIIAIKKIGSAYYALCKNLGQ